MDSPSTQDSGPWVKRLVIGLSILCGVLQSLGPLPEELPWRGMQGAVDFYKPRIGFIQQRFHKDQERSDLSVAHLICTCYGHLGCMRLRPSPKHRIQNLTRFGMELGDGSLSTAHPNPCNYTKKRFVPSLFYKWLLILITP